MKYKPNISFTPSVEVDLEENIDYTKSWSPSLNIHNEEDEQKLRVVSNMDASNKKITPILGLVATNSPVKHIEYISESEDRIKNNDDATISQHKGNTHGISNNKSNLINERSKFHNVSARSEGFNEMYNKGDVINSSTDPLLKSISKYNKSITIPNSFFDTQVHRNKSHQEASKPMNKEQSDTSHLPDYGTQSNQSQREPSNVLNRLAPNSKAHEAPNQMNYINKSYEPGYIDFPFPTNNYNTGPNMINVKPRGDDRSTKSTAQQFKLSLFENSKLEHVEGFNPTLAPIQTTYTVDRTKKQKGEIDNNQPSILSNNQYLPNQVPNRKLTQEKYVTHINNQFDSNRLDIGERELSIKMSRFKVKDKGDQIFRTSPVKENQTSNQENTLPVNRSQANTGFDNTYKSIINQRDYNDVQNIRRTNANYQEQGPETKLSPSKQFNHGLTAQQFESRLNYISHPFDTIKISSDYMDNSSTSSNSDPTMNLPNNWNPNPGSTNKSSSVLHNGQSKGDVLASSNSNTNIKNYFATDIINQMNTVYTEIDIKKTYEQFKIKYNTGLDITWVDSLANEKCVLDVSKLRQYLKWFVSDKYIIHGTDKQIVTKAITYLIVAAMKNTKISTN